MTTRASFELTEVGAPKAQQLAEQLRTEYSATVQALDEREYVVSDIPVAKGAALLVLLRARERSGELKMVWHD